MTQTREDATETAVRAGFKEQTAACLQLGSPFTARLCEVLADGLTKNNEVGRAVLGWAGNPSAFADALPLRVTGALHALVRSGRAPELAALYPPHPLPDATDLLRAVDHTLMAQASPIIESLRSPPQTNEVARSAALLPGLLEISRRTRLPLELYEIGSSAGLNLVLDRYRYRFGDVTWGSPSTPLLLEPQWTGATPAVNAPLDIRARKGCDQNPIDTRDRAQRERLMSYVWPDQSERLLRLEAAIHTALADPPILERADAGEWIEKCLVAGGGPGVTRVLFHSIVWGYLPGATQKRIVQHVSQVGAASREDAPFAWLRLELAGKNSAAELRLTSWPAGQEVLLAEVHPHVAWVRWQ
jgi:hypothetical protein